MLIAKKSGGHHRRANTTKVNRNASQKAHEMYIRFRAVIDINRAKATAHWANG